MGSTWSAWSNSTGRNPRGGHGGTTRDVRPTTGVPVPPESVAAAIVAGYLRRRRLLILGTVGRLSWWISHLAPRWYERMMIRRLLAPQLEEARQKR